MAHRLMWRAGGLAVLVLTAIGAARPLAAQASIVAQFTPTPGVRLHTLVTTEGTAIIAERGAPQGSGISLQFRRREALTARALSHEAGGVVVEVTHDSVSARARPAGGLWIAVEAEAVPAATARALIDRQLSVQAVLEGTLRTGLVGTFDMVLPSGPIAVGSRWASDVGFPLHGVSTVRAELGLDDQVRIDRRLLAQSDVVLDSLVARGTDTLAYLTVSGAVTPRTMAGREPATGGVAVSGAVGGSMIWSTGWGTFVSGGLRSIVVLGLGGGAVGQGQSVPLEVRIDATTQFQLRP